MTPETAQTGMAKNSILLILLFVAVIFMWGGYFYLSAQQKNDLPVTLSSPKSIQAPLTPTPVITAVSLFQKYPGAYKVKVNQNPPSYDIWYVGKVLSVTENNDNSLFVTLLLSKGNMNGKTVTITMSKIPAANQKLNLGNFKELFNKGFTNVYIRIRYSNTDQFLEWELI